MGFGGGIAMSLASYHATQRSLTLTTTGATLLMADGTDAREAAPVNKQRASREEKAASQQQRDDKERQKAQMREAAAAAMAARVESEDANNVHRCGRCRRTFLSNGWYLKHIARWCTSLQDATVEARKTTRVDMILADVDDLRVAAATKQKTKLRVVEVHFRSLSERPEPVGITLAESGGIYSVAAVALHSVAARSAQVSVGLVVMQIDGSKPTSHDQLSGTVGATAMRVQFARPRPQIPYHGSARKGVHKEVRYQMTSEQRTWLESNVFKDGVRVRGMRDKGAFLAMKAAFSDRIRTDTMTPVWLEQSQIATWLAKQVKEEKEKRKVERARATRVRDDDGEASDSQASKQPKICATRVGRGGQGKGKAARKRREGEWEEEEGDGSDYETMEEDESDEGDEDA